MTELGKEDMTNVESLQKNEQKCRQTVDIHWTGHVHS